jgi:hypothetical protein
MLLGANGSETTGYSGVFRRGREEALRLGVMSAAIDRPMFRAFLVYAIEDYSKIPAVEELLRQDFTGAIQTTESSEKTKELLEELERRSGFLDWKQIPQTEYQLAVTGIYLNVNPYYVQWDIVFDVLRRNLFIEWAHWAALR